MPRYIIRSRQLRVSGGISLATVSFEPHERKGQIERALDLRLDDPVEKEVKRWLDQGGDSGVERVIAEGRETAVTGTTIVDMSEEAARRLRQDVAGAAVLADLPLPLIRPIRAGAKVDKVKVGALWHLEATALKAARKRGFTGKGEGVKIAVLDTGIDASHPEITGCVEGTFSFRSESGQAVAQPESVDTDGHGTHVAGLIAGREVGVAPGVRLLNGIMIPQGRGFLSDFVRAIEWAASRADIQIVNMSAGIPGFLDGMGFAIETLLSVGVLPVVAAGNEGRDKTRSPGNYDAVLSVGASSARGRVAWFSSSGALVVGNHQYQIPDLVAPGEAVTSCVRGGGYEAWNGTSMATPIVSGIAALVLESRQQRMSPLQMIDELLESAQRLPDPPTRQGAGLVQLPASVVPAVTRAVAKGTAKLGKGSGRKGKESSVKRKRRR